MLEIEGLGRLCKPCISWSGCERKWVGVLGKNKLMSTKN